MIVVLIVVLVVLAFGLGFVMAAVLSDNARAELEFECRRLQLQREELRSTEGRARAVLEEWGMSLPGEPYHYPEADR